MTAWGPIGRQVYQRTYSRVLPDGTNEEWPDTVRRAVDGNCDLAPGHVTDTERRRLFDLVSEFRIMPAGRHLWVSGVPGSQFIFNCHRAGWGNELADHCGFMFDQLMSGGGVGANYSTAPAYQALGSDFAVRCSRSHPDFFACEQAGGVADHDTDSRFVVPDSREGWVEALRRALRSATITGGHGTTIDVSGVRPAGARIKGFGGVSAGPACLVRMLVSVRDMINAIASARPGARLTGMDLMRIDHAIAECVIAGNVRRSARMSIMHWEDPCIDDFLACKQQDGEHWTTNISVELDHRFWGRVRQGRRDARDMLAVIAEGMRANGEPGIFNSDLAAVGETADVRATNPCGEIPLQEWEPCNLGHLNLAKLSSGAEREEAAELMARFLLRATLSPDVNELQEPVLRRNRRIGVGLYGFHAWLLSSGVKYSDICRTPFKAAVVAAELRHLRRVVTDAAALHADEMGVPRPVKTTSVAPTGSISSLSGDTAGVQPLFAKRFIRRVRYASDDPALGAFPVSAKEPCVHSAGTTVVSMLCEDPMSLAAQDEMLEDSADLTIDDQLAVQRLVQESWADNAVSYTVAVPESSSTGDVQRALLEWGPALKGTTMFPAMTRAQQPIEPVSAEQAERLAVALGAPQSGQTEMECPNGGCPVK